VSKRTNKDGMFSGSEMLAEFVTPQDFKEFEEDSFNGNISDEVPGIVNENKDEDNKDVAPSRESEDMKNFRIRLESVMKTYDNLIKRREARAKCEAVVNATDKKMLAESANKDEEDKDDASLEESEYSIRLKSMMNTFDKLRKRNRCVVQVNKKEILRNLIDERIYWFGSECNLNDIDVSDITDMSGLFEGSEFNGNISEWDVSKVTDMSSMFYHSAFNGDISRWNVSKVTDMSSMFYHSAFNGDISRWDVSNVTNMSRMFSGSQFDGDISRWNVSNVTNMSGMFECSSFYGDISKWNVSNVTNINGMFEGSSFTGDINRIFEKSQIALDTKTSDDQLLTDEEIAAIFMNDIDDETNQTTDE
jgi:surface protein